MSTGGSLDPVDHRPCVKAIEWLKNARRGKYLRDGKQLPNMGATFVTVTRDGPAKIEVAYTGDANNPLIISPAITYSFNLVLDYTDPDHPTYHLTGGHKAFPCYQFYFNSHPLHVYDSGGKTASALLTGSNTTITVDRSQRISPDW